MNDEDIEFKQSDKQTQRKKLGLLCDSAYLGIITVIGLGTMWIALVKPALENFNETLNIIFGILFWCGLVIVYSLIQGFFSKKK